METLEQVTEEVTEELVDGSSTEEVETTEEVEKEQGKLYTDEEINAIINKRVGRIRNKLEKEYAPYKDTENMLKAVVGGENIEEINQKVREGYKKEGVEVPEKMNFYSEQEIKILGLGEANEIIDEGFDSMESEANRLAAIGYQNLDEKEKIVFMTLGNKLQEIKTEKELLKIGADKDLVTSKEFSDFRKKFDRNTEIKEIYDLYSKTNKKEIKTIGSMKNADATKVKKEFYTREEVSKLTQDDFARDPELLGVVRKSMTSGKW